MIDIQKQAMGSQNLNALPFDSTAIRFDLEIFESLHRRGACIKRNKGYHSITQFYKTLVFNLL